MEEAVSRAAFGFLALIKGTLKIESSNKLLNVWSAYRRYWRSEHQWKFIVLKAPLDPVRDIIASQFTQ